MTREKDFEEGIFLGHVRPTDPIFWKILKTSK